MYLGSCGIPGQCVKFMRRTLDRWAGKKDGIIGNSRERVGETVRGLSGDSYLSELSDKYYNDDGVSVEGIHGPPATDPDLTYLLSGVCFIVTSVYILLM